MYKFIRAPEIQRRGKIRTLANILIGFCLATPTAFAIEPDRCPASVTAEVQVLRVYKNSIYSNVPGWREAQQALQNMEPLTLTLGLDQRYSESCEYRNESGDAAWLSTSRFRDPDEANGVKSDQLNLNFNFRSSRFVTFIPVKSYGLDDIAAYSSPFNLKIKTRLYYQKTKRWVNFDIGMISIALR